MTGGALPPARDSTRGPIGRSGQAGMRTAKTCS